MEVLFLCLFRMQIRAIVLLRRLLCSRGPDRGLFLFACSARRSSPFRSSCSDPSHPTGLVGRDGIGGCRRLGFTRLVGAVNSISRDWSLPSIRFHVIVHRDRSGSVDLARRQAFSMI